jgi:LemA protein
MSPSLWILLGVVVVLGAATIASYNRFVRQRNAVQESWRQVDVELHRRHDLIPNLVETVRGYAAHERTVLDEVTEARGIAAAAGSSPEAQAGQEDILGRALSRLFAVSENYPQLRADGRFGQLQTELADTEDRIAASRRLYNGNVRSLNTRVESFPSSLVASFFGFKRAGYFTAADPEVRKVPSVSF